MYIVLPLLALGTAGTRRGAILIEEHFFDVLPENSGDFEGERKTWIVASRFDGVDASSRNPHVQCELGLRPLHLGTKYSEARLHSSCSAIDRCRAAARTKPTVHKIIMLTGTAKVGTTGTRKPRVRRKSRRRAIPSELTNPNTSLVQLRAHRGLQ
jgi:hypothetical protein